MKKLKVGMLLFPDLTLMDFVGPYDVFIRAQCLEVVIVSETTSIIHAEGGLSLKADVALEDCPSLDILFVPGGRGINPLLTHQSYLTFLQRQGKKAKYITSVCTGSLVLAAAGLLKGFKATTHWRSHDLLRMFDVDVVNKRVVIDRNRITGGGVTSGIDFGLVLTSIIGGDEMAKAIQLMLEYAPAPPYESGLPELADPYIVETAKKKSLSLYNERVAIIQRILAGNG